MHWRRFALSSIPIGDSKAFELWLKNVWLEKEALLEYFAENGRFPADDGQDSEVKAAPKGAGFIETEVTLAHWWEIGRIFVVAAALALIAKIGADVWNLAVYGNFTGAS
jgi:hypothetical protein